MDLGVKEPDDICYYLETFYVVSVEFVATMNRVETTLFKNSFFNYFGSRNGFEREFTIKL